MDLEQRRPVDLLPDREPETVAAWLRQHPDVQIISRDRGTAYIEGATRGAPQAVQVADRWHLLKNLGDALERLLTGHHKALHEATAPSQQEAGAPVALPEPSTVRPSSIASADQSARRERSVSRFEEVKEVKRLTGEGHSLREVARCTGLAPDTVRCLACCEQFPEMAARPQRKSKLAPFADYLLRRWNEGCCKAR